MTCHNYYFTGVCHKDYVCRSQNVFENGVCFPRSFRVLLQSMIQTIMQMKYFIVLLYGAWITRADVQTCLYVSAIIMDTHMHFFQAVRSSVDA